MQVSIFQDMKLSLMNRTVKDHDFKLSSCAFQKKYSCLGHLSLLLNIKVCCKRAVLHNSWAHY